MALAYFSLDHTDDTEADFLGILRNEGSLDVAECQLNIIYVGIVAYILKKLFSYGARHDTLVV